MTEKQNWIGSSELLGLIRPAIQINENPYYQKWKRGRPTREMIKQRDLWQKWEMDNNHLFKLINSIKDAKPNYKHKEKSFLNTQAGGV